MNKDLAKIAENILKYRKLKGLTQESLAEKLGVSFQAVSKWENGQSCPDILLLPQLAEIFEVTIDGLLGRKTEKAQDPVHVAGLSWPDDGIIRGVVFSGHTILDICNDMSKFAFKLEGQAMNVVSYCNIECDEIQKGATAGGNINCHNISGGASAGGDLICGGSVSGGASAGGDLTCGGSVSGGASTGGDLACGGGISGGVGAGGDLTCGMITGEVSVKGDLTVEDKVKGDVKCEGDIYCRRIEGDVTCSGSIIYEK